MEFLDPIFLIVARLQIFITMDEMFSEGPSPSPTEVSSGLPNFPTKDDCNKYPSE